jgi:CO/xanthine dehydrogenase Mo-binding subunit
MRAGDDTMTVAETKQYNQVGRSVPRVDADEKVRGLAVYADDVPLPGCWYAEVVRSPVSCGRLKKLNFDPAFDWSRVCVVTPADIPGENIVDMIGRDMPFIAHDWIQYRGEPLALIAAPTRALAREAAARVKADIEAQPALLNLPDLVARYKADPAHLHRLAAQTIVKGDVARGLAEAEVVVEGEYWAGHQEQLYIEPQGMLAIPEEDGGVFLQGSLQCPYYIAPELIITLKLPLEKIRVQQAAVGGAFGGKEEFPTLIAGYCALLALKCRKPVKLIYDRHQDILYTTKRHPVWVKHRTGLQARRHHHGHARGFPAGWRAYTTLSPVVMYRGILHTTLGYRCENVLVDGHVYRTNTFPNGAFRGFGAPQAIWALESHMDVCAEKLGLAPHEFRLRNALHVGDATATGQVLSEPMGTPDVLEKTLERSQFAERFARCSRGKPGPAKWYGIGLAFFGHGSGFTGDGESRLKSKAALDLEPGEDGRPGVSIRISSTEMGQGTLTIMPQIAADALSVELDERAHVRWPTPSMRRTAGPPWPRAPPWWWAARCMARRSKCARPGRVRLRRAAPRRAGDAWRAAVPRPISAARVAPSMKSRAPISKSTAACGCTTSSNCRPPSSGTRRRSAAIPIPPIPGAATWPRWRWTR